MTIFRLDGIFFVKLPPCKCHQIINRMSHSNSLWPLRLHNLNSLSPNANKQKSLNIQLFVSGATRFGINTGLPKSTNILQNVAKHNPLHVSLVQQFSCLTINPPTTKLLANPSVQTITNGITSRTVTKFSYRKGRRKAVKVVLKKFYRLNWGGWIRTKCGRNKKLWKKTSARKRRLRQHVLCNATQSRLLDKMVGSYWRKPKYYVDDPYNPYHSREEFVYTAKKPRPFFPPENWIVLR